MQSNRNKVTQISGHRGVNQHIQNSKDSGNVITKTKKTLNLLPLVITGGISLSIGSGAVLMTALNQTITQPKIDQTSSESQLLSQHEASSSNNASWLISIDGSEKVVLGEFQASSRKQAEACFITHENERETKKIPNACLESAGITNYPFEDLKGAIESKALTLGWFDDTKNVPVQVYRTFNGELLRMSVYTIRPTMH